MKRFWKEASVAQEGKDFAILLDKRPLRTPARAHLLLPTRALADAIAGEWQECAETVDPRAMPLTGLANAALDRIAPDLAAHHAGLARYGESDVVAYRADHPDALVAHQAAHWDPVLDWAQKRYGATLTVTRGIMHQPQPPQALESLRAAVSRYNAFETAALTPLVTLSGSLLIALMLAEGAIAPEAAWQAGQLDELWQVSQWGEDSLAAAARAEKKAAFEAGWRFLGHLRA